MTGGEAAGCQVESGFGLLLGLAVAAKSDALEQLLGNLGACLAGALGQGGQRRARQDGVDADVVILN